MASLPDVDDLSPWIGEREEFRVDESVVYHGVGRGDQALARHRDQLRVPGARTDQPHSAPDS